MVLDRTIDQQLDQLTVFTVSVCVSVLSSCRLSPWVRRVKGNVSMSLMGKLVLEGKIKDQIRWN